MDDVFQTAYTPFFYADQLREIERVNRRGQAAGRASLSRAADARTTIPARFRARLDRLRSA